MWSAIGLALDLVGAVALVLGLFRWPRPLTVGWSHSPDQAAGDVAYAVTGGTFLAAGFVLQSLTYFGVDWNGSDRAALVAALATVVVGALAAFVLYGVTFLIALPFEVRYSRVQHNLNLRVRRQRKGFRFWNQVVVPSSTVSIPGSTAPKRGP